MILCERLINQSDNTSFKLWNYDAAGNPLSDGTATLTWNAAGKLSTIVKNAKTHTYKTNGLDQRISKNGPLSAKFFFFYDPTGQLIGEYLDNSSTATPADDWLVRQETIWLEDIPVAVIRKPTATSPIQIYFVHADHLNTPRVIVNQSNTPVWRWENTHAFGANLPDEDPDGNSQLFEYHPRFPGQYFDPYGLFDTSLSELARKAINVNNSVNQCSAAYSGGQYAGYGLSVGLGGAGLVRGVIALGPRGRIIGHPAYGGRTIDGFRSGEIRFGWGRDKGPTLRLGIRNRHIDIVRLRPPQQ